MIPVIINLPQSTDRKLKIEEKVKPYFLTHIIIEAVDGLRLKDDEYRNTIAESLGISEEKLQPSYFNLRKNYQSYGRDITKIMKKVGCFLSHLLALKFSIQNNLYNVLILEDDFLVNKNIYNLDINQCSGLITYLGGQGRDTIPINNGVIPLDKFELIGAYGYMVKTKEDMVYISSLMYSCFNDGIGRIKLKNDFNPMKDRLKMMCIDLFYKKFMHKKCICMYPIIIEHDDKEISTIDTSKKYKKRYGLKCISKLVVDSL